MSPVMLLPLLAGVSTAAAPVPTNGALSQITEGSLGAETYYVKSTWVLTTGETAGATETSLAVSANNVLVVAAPASPPPNAIGWNVYVSEATGTETKQNGSTVIALGASWTLPTTGLVAGSAVPTGTVGEGSGIILLDVSPFEGGRNRNAFLDVPGLPAGSVVVEIFGTDLAAGGPTPSPTDPSWTLLYTLNASSPPKQEIQLPTWIMANVTTTGSGTVTANLEGIQ